jgi:hypothetical protein
MVVVVMIVRDWSFVDEYCLVLKTVPYHTSNFIIISLLGINLLYIYNIIAYLILSHSNISHPTSLALSLLNGPQSSLTSNTSANLLSISTCMTNVYTRGITQVLLFHQITEDFIRVRLFIEIHLSPNEIQKSETTTRQLNKT